MGQAKRRCPDKTQRIQLAIERREAEAREKRLKREHYLASLTPAERKRLEASKRKGSAWLAAASLLVSR